MKKTVLFLSLFLFSFLADANPLFFSDCAIIVQNGEYDYFYDATGDLLGREELGESGRVYVYLGDRWSEEGYFVEDNGWDLYYCSWRNNEYVGKLKQSYEEFREGNKYYEKETRFYVDYKNRPVATYDESLSGHLGESISTVLGTLDYMLDPLGTLMNSGRTPNYTFLVLRGTVRRYTD